LITVRTLNFIQAKGKNQPPNCYCLFYGISTNAGLEISDEWLAEETYWCKQKKNGCSIAYGLPQEPYAIKQPLLSGNLFNT
jgi:hypothetical protein